MKIITNNYKAYMICFLFFISVFVFARDIEITVEDEDLSIPLEGAAVTLRDRQRFVCDANGRAFVTLPDDRPTVVTITYPGYDILRFSIPAATGSGRVEQFKAKLRIGGIMESQELVIEAARPETSETRVGRSVAISDRELARTAEIGIIEDVMNSVKLLPGVGYTGMFGAMPSIRGGDPGDLMAALDGFYLENPYHWMGAVSIFDPKMVSSARLSHGIFSARYGHTVSGLLEVTSKTPSHTETELELSIGSSAANINLSLPFAGKGGLLFMGRVTYWDTLIWTAQGLSRVIEDENLDLINTVSTSPFIRSAGLSMHYRITPDMDWRLNAFFGSDGIGAEVNTDYSQFINDDGITGIIETKADYGNYQGFLISGLTVSPSPKLALRFNTGLGFMYTNTDAYINNDITTSYNEDFLSLLPETVANDLKNKTFNAPNVDAGVYINNSTFNAQARADADIDLGKGFIAAFGIQELYSMWNYRQDIDLSFLELPVNDMPLPPIYRDIPNLAIIIPMSYNSDLVNHGLTSSAYGLLEYTSPNRRFGAELGLRVDHLYFIGKDFSFQTMPALNPRLNIDFGIIKNSGFIDSLTTTIGTGLFSSINSLLPFFNPEQFGMNDSSNLNDIDVKFNRSWTSVIGFKIDFFEKFSFNMEGYYKRIFDRGYITADLDSSGKITPSFNFDGIGDVWGFDLQFQLMESRFIDGWISYSFNWVKYHDKTGSGQGFGMLGGQNISTDEDIVEQWYYPSYHRFHNANIVLNIKPATWFNIAVRFGFASGQETEKVSNEIEPYPVLLGNEDGTFTIIQKYRRKQLETVVKERRAWSLPLDVKVSFFPVNRNGRTNMEIYLAAENLLSLVYYPESDVISFNEYTGTKEEQASSANFDLPIPMVSFGFKWRY